MGFGDLFSGNPDKVIPSAKNFFTGNWTGKKNRSKTNTVLDVVTGGGHSIVDDFLHGDTRRAAAAQERAAREAMARQEAEAQRTRDWLEGRSNLGIDIVNQRTDQAVDALDRSRGDLKWGAQGAGQSIDRGFTGAEQDLTQGYGDAEKQLGGLADLVGRYGDKSADVIGDFNRLGLGRDQAYSGFEADPGYQFRLQQGEQAINRAQSAKGNRLGGAAYKALADYNSGLASQEFANFASRRDAANRNTLAALLAEKQRQGQLADIGYGAQGSLADLMVERGQGLSTLDLGRGAADAEIFQGLGHDLASNNAAIADTYTNAGNSAGNIAIGTAAPFGQISQNLMEQYNNPVKIAGGGDQAVANQRQGIMSVIAAMFSDVRLKSEIEPVNGSKYEALGLQAYRWKWNDKAKDLGLSGYSRGLIAQDVLAKYPDAVGTRRGYFVINYAELERLLRGQICREE